MLNSLRRFSCARCGLPVLICGGCDRGNIYCGPLCSALSRFASLKEAGRRYQATFKGAMHHAKRQQKYRARQGKNNAVMNKVTHQTSPELTPSDLLNLAARVPIEVMSGHCHFCKKYCSEFTRWAFYKRRGEAGRIKSFVWPQGP
jgi:hypothetical protein